MSLKAVGSTVASSKRLIISQDNEIYEVTTAGDRVGRQNLETIRWNTD